MISLAAFVFKIQKYYFPVDSEICEETLVCDEIVKDRVNYSTAINKSVDTKEKSREAADSDRTTIGSDCTTSPTLECSHSTSSAIDEDSLSSIPSSDKTLADASTFNDVLAVTSANDSSELISTATAILNLQDINISENLTSTYKSYKHVNLTTSKEQNGIAIPVQGKTITNHIANVSNTSDEKNYTSSSEWMCKENNVYHFKYTKLPDIHSSVKRNHF